MSKKPSKKNTNDGGNKNIAPTTEKTDTVLAENKQAGSVIADHVVTKDDILNNPGTDLAEGETVTIEKDAIDLEAGITDSEKNEAAPLTETDNKADKDAVRTLENPPKWMVESRRLTEKLNKGESIDGVVKNEGEVNAGPGPLPAPETVATLENPPAWMLKYREDMRKTGAIDPKATRIEVLQRSIDRCFADHEKTILPKLTEAEVLNFIGNKGDGIKIEFIYSNDEKTSGYITLKEFDVEKRCPEAGEFNFGIDFSKGR